MQMLTNLVFMDAITVSGKPVRLAFQVYCQVAIVVRNLPANAGDTRDLGSISGLGQSPGGGYGNPLQHSCLENPMERGGWQATVLGVAKSRTRLND